MVHRHTGYLSNTIGQVPGQAEVRVVTRDDGLHGEQQVGALLVHGEQAVVVEGGQVGKLNGANGSGHHGVGAGSVLVLEGEDIGVTFHWHGMAVGPSLDGLLGH